MATIGSAIHHLDVAEAFRRDLPAARIVLLETGHFALETDGNKVADEIKNFFPD